MDRACILQDSSAAPEQVLAQLLARAGFWETIEAARVAAAGDFRIVILPDLEFFAPGAPTFTDPRLVEELIDLLHARGFTDVAVGSSPNEWMFWLENRDVPVLADLAGYRYLTSREIAYDVVDLVEETISDRFPPQSVLHGTAVSRRWAEAQFRINFAKNKTDEANAFALGAQNLLSILPFRERDPQRLPSAEVATALLRHVPPHFTIIDAFVSNHGPAGVRAANPLPTHTLIASPSPLLADWAASLKMGLDPYSSPLNAQALREIGLPARYQIDGSLAPYDAWANVPPLLLDSARKRSASRSFTRLAEPWFQQVDPVLFPFKELLHERANAWATKFFGSANSDSAALVASIAVNYLIAASHTSSEAMRIVFAKHTVPQRQTGLGFDPASYSREDYEAVAPYMEQWEQIISHSSPDSAGMRWRYIDGSVVFSMSQLVPVPFERWRERVDIANSVSSMNDYIGGARVPLQRDALGLVTHQAERNIYLPQPNWMAFFGGDYIDVCKLEHVRYFDDSQRIYWQTISSPNGSADFDDGIVEFARAGEASTSVTIIARQKFRLPLFWQAVNMDLFPSIKNILVAHAYENYFRGTLRNFQAQFEGREHRIGRAPDSAEPDKPLPSAAETLLALFGLQPADVEKYAGMVRAVNGPAPAAALVDEHGFRHFPGSQQTSDGADPFARAVSEGRSFLTGLADAMRKDLGLQQER